MTDGRIKTIFDHYKEDSQLEKSVEELDELKEAINKLIEHNTFHTQKSGLTTEATAKPSLITLLKKYPERVQEISAWEHLVSASSGKPVTFYPNESFRERVNRAWSKVYGRAEK